MKINKFISRNIGLMIPDENYAVTYDVTRLQLSSGELLPPAVTTVVFTQKRQPLLPLAPDEDRVYGINMDKRKKLCTCFSFAAKM